MPEFPVSFLTWTELFRTLIAGSLGWAGASLHEWIKKQRSPAEERKTDAEARQIHVNTDVSLMQAASGALSKALHLQDKCELQQRQLESLRCQLDLADENVRASALFVTQLNRAAKLAGVNLSDYTPKELRAPKALRDVVRKLDAGDHDNTQDIPVQPLE
jgi:hypothetical protein